MLKWLFPLLMLISFASCTPAIDPNMARLCRIAIPVLEDPDAAIDIKTQRHIFPQDRTSYQIEIVYQTQTTAQKDGSHRIVCLFELQSGAPVTDRLSGVSRDWEELSESRLFFLQRFWLKVPDSSLADPQAISGLQSAVSVSPRLAYALQHIINSLPAVAIYGLLAAAYSLIFGLVGRINLAFGEFAAVGGAAAALALFSLDTPPPLAQAFAALTLALFASALHGGVLGKLVYLPLARKNGQHALVGTIGLAIFLQEYLRLAQGNEQRWVPPLFHSPFIIARSGDFSVVLSPIVILIALIGFAAAAAILIVMKYSRFGKNWRAFSDDPLAAQLFGINPQAQYLVTFTLACACAGLAGTLITFYFGGLGFGASTTLGLKALIAAVLGGIGSVQGAFLGGILVAGVEAIWSAYFPIDYRDLVVFLLLAVTMILRPAGLLGLRDVPIAKI